MALLYQPAHTSGQEIPTRGFRPNPPFKSEENQGQNLQLGVSGEQ
jgi:hypothetical protein